jgi:formate/nitrite transporter FocA (FNT family)
MARAVRLESLRWLLALPVGFAAAFAASVAIRLIVLHSLNPHSLAHSLVPFERLGSALVFPFALVVVATLVAAPPRLETAAALSASVALVPLTLVVLNVTPLLDRFSVALFLCNLVGSAAGFVVFYRRGEMKWIVRVAIDETTPTQQTTDPVLVPST